MENEGRNVEELNDKGWITDLVPCGCDLVRISRPLTGVCGSTTALRVEIRSWGDRFILHNFVQFPHLKSLDASFSLSLFGNTPSLLLCFVFSSRRVRRKIPRLKNYRTKIFVVCFTCKGRH